MQSKPTGSQRIHTFTGGDIGAWRVDKIKTVIGSPISNVSFIEMVQSDIATMPETLTGKSGWQLRGVTSNERYVTHDEKAALVSKQSGLGRESAICGALIPIRKNQVWWALAQDERRQIIEEQSRHIRIGMKYLPAISRRLIHCRDLDPGAPFDFLTWFEFAPADATAFNELVDALRATPEWMYVEHEVDIRLVRAT